LLRGFGVVFRQLPERTPSSGLIAPLPRRASTHTPGGDCRHFPIRGGASVGHHVPSDGSWDHIGQDTAGMALAADNRVRPATHLRCRLQAANGRLAAFRGINCLARRAIERWAGGCHAARQTDGSETQQRIPKHLKPLWSASLTALGGSICHQPDGESRKIGSILPFGWVRCCRIAPE